jgi:hypothetical protein
VLQALLLFALLLTGALAGHNTKLLPGLDSNGLQSSNLTTNLIGGLDPDGLQSAAPTTNLGPGTDPNGTK